MKASRIKIVAIVLALLLAVVIFFVFIVIRPAEKNKTSVKTFSVPSDTTIKINGKEAGKNFTLSPGEYKITGDKDGFDVYEYRVVIKENDPEKELFFVLNPVTESAKEWAEKNQKAYADIEEKAGRSAQQEGAKIIDKNPIISLLPHTQSYYRIDYKQDPDIQDIVIQVSGNALGRQVALEKIRSWGFEPTDYVFEFRGFESIFEAQDGGPPL